MCTPDCRTRLVALPARRQRPTASDASVERGSRISTNLHEARPPRANRALSRAERGCGGSRVRPHQPRPAAGARLRAESAVRGGAGGRSGPRRAGCVAGLYGSGRLTRRWVRAAEDPGGDFPAQYVWVAIHAKAERADETCDRSLRPRTSNRPSVPAPFGLSFHVRSEDMSGDRSAERFARAGRHACAGKHDSTSRHETATPGVSELCARPRYILYSYLLALVVSTGCTVGVGLIALVVLLHLSCHDPLDLPGPMPWAFVLFDI